MQMTDFGSADLYAPGNNWYPSQFPSISNSFNGLNSNLANITGSSGHHQLNPLNQLHHPLDSATNVLHNSPPNSTSPQQTHPPNNNNSQLTNLSNSTNLTSLTQNTTQSNQHLISPLQAATVQTTTQSRSNSTSLNLSTSSNSTSTNSSNNTLTSYSTQLNNSSVAAHLHPATHQFNIPSHLNVHSSSAQHPTHHNQFSPHSLSAHHTQHPLNHLTAHHHFLNVSNNFFPVHHSANTTASLAGTNGSAFTTPPSPSSPNNTSINSTTNAFNSLTFHRPESASNASGAASNGANYERMHPGYSFHTTDNSLTRNYTSLMDHSSRTSGLEFVGLRHHMPTLTNLTSSTGNNHLNNLEDSNVNSMFIAHHNPNNLMASHLNSTNNNVSNNVTSLVSLHGSTHNNSINSSSDSRQNGEDDLNLTCIKQEDEDNKLNIANSQFTNSITDHPMSQYSWVKKNPHNSQPQAGNKRKTRTRDKYRVVYTDTQRIELEKEFIFSRYITIRRKSELAQALNLSERQVKIWFQNRRAKSRKLNKKKETEGDFKPMNC